MFSKNIYHQYEITIYGAAFFFSASTRYPPAEVLNTMSRFIGEELTLVVTCSYLSKLPILLKPQILVLNIIEKDHQA